MHARYNDEFSTCGLKDSGVGVGLKEGLGLGLGRSCCCRSSIGSIAFRSYRAISACKVWEVNVG
jgi:hypothetical protein